MTNHRRAAALAVALIAAAGLAAPAQVAAQSGNTSYAFCSTPRRDADGANIVTYFSAVFPTTRSWMDSTEFDAFIRASYDQRTWNSREQCTLFYTEQDAIKGLEYAKEARRPYGKVVSTDWRP
ncbi:hypothetical protein [Phenylobacterium sp.]|uniref:hypothetical protein n=1 Tax=Phenylobacterium sp. TaxID=1871053 RepID=UPI00391BED53